MEPPAGRILLDDRVQVPGGRQGRIVGERLIPSNGAWRYAVALEDGSTVEHFDFELKRVEAR